jgi:TATA-box binding protein (TBP) (component of TFIID and TFIIIB)
MLATTTVNQTQSQITFNIENVVATANLNQTLNPKKIIKKISGI